MRALVCHRYGTFKDLSVEDWDEPEVGKGQVAVEVRAAGLNFPDLLSIAGKYQVRSEPPFIPGIEAAGVVKEVGEGVTRHSPGDRVIVTVQGGAFAEVCVADESRLMPLPESLGFEQGAGFAITYATSYHAFRQRAPIERGQTVLVLGAAGGVGTTAVEIAKLMGAWVIAAASSAEKLEFAREVGADDSVDYSHQPLKETVRELTGGRGADIVYDPVGGELARQSLSALAWDGRYLVVGFASGEIPAFPANLLLLREVSVIGVYWGDWAAKNPQLAASNMQEVAGLVASGELKPRITAAYPLERFEEALSALAERRALGKIVLTF
jgi:NADPH2:quinone reductase